MALEDVREDMEMCCKCSICKFIPLEKCKGFERAYVCPSITKYNYNAYSGGGRVNIGVALTAFTNHRVMSSMPSLVSR